MPLIFGSKTPPESFSLNGKMWMHNITDDTWTRIFTNTTLSDTDGMFWLNWSKSTFADNYSIYWSTSPGVDDGDTLYVDDLVNNTMFLQ